MLTRDDLLTIGRMCRIITGNDFGNKELDSLALRIGHYPDVLNPPNLASSSTATGAPAGEDESSTRRAGEHDG